MEQSNKPYVNPLIYTNNPLLAGYVSTDNNELIKNSAGIGVHFLGKGRIITYTDNQNFRSYWLATNKLFMNGIFFSKIIKNPSSH